MKDDGQHWLEILRHNRGFATPERWIPYARAHGFQKVEAQQLDACPDCGTERTEFIAQYVYYSTLLELRVCGGCGLAFSDKRIDPEVVRAHFELSYKDELYFSRKRRRIFGALARLAAAAAPPGGLVIDIGGAQGHLLAELRRLRPDLELTLCDLSERACADAAEAHGFRTVRCAIPELADLRTRYHVIMLIDVLYYEPDLRRAWKTLAAAAADPCTLLIRVPNRTDRLRFLRRVFPSPPGRSQQTSIPAFNPEHVYAFSRAYLEARLRSLGFHEVEFHPSPLLDGGLRGFLARTYFRLASLLHGWSRGRWILTPCLIAVAKKGSRGEPLPS